MTEQTPRTDRPDTQWDVVKTISHDSGYMVRIQRLPANPPRYSRPRFSIEVGQIRKDGKFSRYLNPVYTVSEGRVTIASSAAVIMELIAQAEEYVLAELQQAIGSQQRAKPMVPVFSSTRR